MLFDADVIVEFTPDEWAIFDRPVIGDGGAQNLLRELHESQVRPRQLRTTYRLLDRAYGYAYAYGGGGFQDRFRMVVRAARRTGAWTADGIIEKKPRPQSAGAFGRVK